MIAMLDIGLDLGTSTIVAGTVRQGIVVKEPAIIALDTRTNKILSIGGDIQKMVGRENNHLKMIYPLQNGVISDYEMTRVLVKHFLKIVGKNHMLKPRVIICVPTGITQVEALSVVSAATESGARQTLLIHEPVAAALGAGLDISRPDGKMVVDIGGGSSDTAILSMYGVVSKSSVRVAGNAFDEAIAKYIKHAHNIEIGANTAEQIKIQLGSVGDGTANPAGIVKGYHIVTQMPASARITRRDLFPSLYLVAMEIAGSVQEALEVTPPELISDVHNNGLLLTGGGAMIHGLDAFFSKYLRVPTRLADNPTECAGLGTIRAFEYIDKDFEGFFTPSDIR